MPSQTKKVVHTYKAGLKLPASLLEPFTQLVREREILQFLRRYPNHFSPKQAQRLRTVSAPSGTPAHQWACFQVYKNLNQAGEAIRNDYRTLLAKYGDRSRQAVEVLLRENQQQITFFTRSDLHYDPTLTLKGRIHESARPEPTEISVHDYQYLARQYFKHLCGITRTYARENIEKLPLDDALTERQVTTLLGTKANHLHSVSTQMATMMNVGNATRRKVEDVKGLFQTPGNNGKGFREVVPVYLTFYSVPSYFRNYLAKAWQVDAQWVRDTLVGWRRKLDPRLPKKVQIEPLTVFMEELAQECHRFCQDEQEWKIIGRLQQRHVLHLLPTKLPLEALLRSKDRRRLEGLRARIVFSPAVQAKIAAITSRISLDLFGLGVEDLCQQIRDLLATLEKLSPGTARTQTFLNKLDVLQTHMVAFPDLLDHYLPGNRYTASAAKIILYSLDKEGKNRTHVKRLFTALRGVIASAFAQLYPEATAQFWTQFTPDHCVTRPFISPKKTKKYLPLELKSPKYVILRKKHPNEKSFVNNKDTTELFRDNQPLWLGFNLYTPDQFRVAGTLTGHHKGTLWFRLFPTKKIRTCIQRGAVVQAIRLNVPQGATNKIVADIILGAETRAPFCHSMRFLQNWAMRFPNVAFPNATYLGSDLNQLGPYMLALGTEHEELDITPLMADFDRAAHKLVLFRKKVIPTLQHNLTCKKDGKTGRRKTELTNLHKKRQQLMREANQRALMVYLYAIWQTRTQHVGWDRIEGLNPRGKKGDFAVAVQSLPNNQEQFLLFEEWLADLQQVGVLSPDIQIHPVSPFTSAICPRCYAKEGKRKRTRDKTTPYYEFRCCACGYTGNRHSTAAMVEAIDMKITVEGLP